jgi:flavin reductase (DIM6/NTAB) family NADH-FMN oxidoreductase RutF
MPRPIGWITSLSADGTPNLAPFSFFNAVSDKPPQVMYAPQGPHKDGGQKDSLLNVEATKEFVANMATWALKEEMRLTSTHLDRGASEFTLSGLETEPSALVKPPRVKATPIHLECRLVKTVELLSDFPERPNFIVIGEVVGIHISDDVLTNGMVDIAKVRPISRLGYLDYAVTSESFSMVMPD